MFSRLLIALMFVLPNHLLSRMAGLFASIPIPTSLRALVFRGYCAVFGARSEEAEHPFEHYRTLNEWFTRTLKPGLRPIAPGALVSPVDGKVGAAGSIREDTLWQAKGRTYSLRALLGDDALASDVAEGTYQTLYLAPKDYHRIHSPLDAAVVKATYIPGHLWPVNTHAVMHVKQLFAVNERLVIEMRMDHDGVMALVAVGATMVGKTRVVFDDLHTNARRRRVDARSYDPPIRFAAGAALGHFEFGSTVILICSPRCGALEELEVGRVVKLGEPIGRLANGARASVPPRGPSSNGHG